jgi:hypothetical protein
VWKAEAQSEPSEYDVCDGPTLHESNESITSLPRAIYDVCVPLPESVIKRSFGAIHCSRMVSAPLPLIVKSDLDLHKSTAILTTQRK